MTETTAEAAMSPPVPDGAGATAPAVPARPEKPKRERPSRVERRTANADPNVKGLDDFLPEAQRGGGEGPTTQGQLVRVPTASVMRHPQNNRVALDEENVKEKVASIREVGFLGNLLLTSVPPERKVDGVLIPEGIEYLAVDGWHRLEAAKRLQKPFVPGLLRSDWTEALIIEASHSANSAHSLPTPYEDACYIRDALKANPGMTHATLAKRKAKGEAWVQQRLKYLKVPADLGVLLGDGRREAACIDVALLFLPDDLPTAQYEEVYPHVLRAAREKEDRRGEGRFLTAEAFFKSVRKALVEKLKAIEPASFENESKRRYAPWKRAMEETKAATLDLPTYYGSDHSAPLVLDRKPFDAAEAEIVKLKEAVTTRAPRSSLSAEEKAKRAAKRRETAIHRRSRELQLECLAKGLLPITSLDDPRAIEVFLAVAAERVDCHQDAQDRIADLVGLDVRDLKAAFERPRHATTAREGVLKLYQKLKKTDPAIAARFIIAACAFHAHEPLKRYEENPRNEQVFRVVTNSTWTATKKAAEKELDEFEKAKKEGRPPRVKPTDDERDVACPTCAQPEGKGGVRHANCVGKSGHKLRVSHTSRIKQWEKTRLSAKTPKEAGKGGKERPSPRSGGRMRAAKAAAGAPDAPAEEGDE